VLAEDESTGDEADEEEAAMSRRVVMVIRK
jgi:hypothetical protein